MTAALLARAGGAKAFVGNHQAIFAAFPAMIAKVQKATEAQKKSWFEGTTAERARKIAADTGLPALMRARGHPEAQPAAALGTAAAPAVPTRMTNIDRSPDPVDDTPSCIRYEVGHEGHKGGR